MESGVEPLLAMCIGFVAKKPNLGFCSFIQQNRTYETYGFSDRHSCFFHISSLFCQTLSI